MYWTEYRRAWLKRLSTVKEGDRLLDAGCGDAWVKNEFARYNEPIDYYGIDLAVGDENLSYKVTALADLHSLPFKDSSFDKVISNSVLEHVENPTEVFSEMVRVTRPGGRIFLSVPFAFALHQRPYDYHRFTRYILERYAHRNKLKIISLWNMGGFFTVLRYIFFNYTLLSLNDHPLWVGPFKIINFVTKLFDKTIGAPIVFLLDFLDRNKYLTLGYFVVYQKDGSLSGDLPEDPFRCPVCHQDSAEFEKSEIKFSCNSCHHDFPVKDKVPNLTLSDSFEPITEKISKD
ncbi:MAG: methyltransferase domain-containing protein [Halobacteriovoraceae bacterium]|jgi:SAM-dependent methyltransferase|nr:methyltransferase domain-containing protein [Halobacteriovoraceae bacterium]